MRIYLDNNATTPLHPEVLERFQRALRETFGNASSIHEEGQRARRTLEEAREAVSALIGAPARQLVFTSGGTESNNLALFGAVGPEVKRCHIVTSSIEHPSVLEVVRQLERRGHEVSFAGCDSSGVVSVEEVKALLRDDTRLVSVMLANNEVGALQPVAELAHECRSRAIHFHCDAVQGAGKISIDVEALGVDSLSISGHKMHAPKGIGALYLRAGVTLHPHLAGGAQERRRRAGTENVPLAAAFATAAALFEPDEMQRVRTLRDDFERRVIDGVPSALVNAAGAQRVPNTSNLTLRGVDAEGLVIALDLNGVAASTGSACSSGRVEPSHVLLAMGLSLEDARSSIRFSLSRFTTEEEVERAAAIVVQHAPLHQRQPRVIA